MKVQLLSVFNLIGARIYYCNLKVHQVQSQIQRSIKYIVGFTYYVTKTVKVSMLNHCNNDVIAVSCTRLPARPNHFVKDAFIGSAGNHNTITPSSRDTENVLVHKYKLNHLERSPGTDRPTINGNVYLTNLSPGGFNRMDSSDYG